MGRKPALEILIFKALLNRTSVRVNLMCITKIRGNLVKREAFLEEPIKL